MARILIEDTKDFKSQVIDSNNEEQTTICNLRHLRYYLDNLCRICMQSKLDTQGLGLMYSLGIGLESNQAKVGDEIHA